MDKIAIVLVVIIVLVSLHNIYLVKLHKTNEYFDTPSSGSQDPIQATGSIYNTGLLETTNMTVTGDITINGNNNIITKGMIVAFSPVATGSNESIIPTGWAICDGTNGTPDLRAKFVMGASDITPILSTGGSTTVDITAKHIPTHTHTYDMKSKMYTNQPQYVLNIKNIAEYNIMQKHPKLWIDTKIITANTSNAGGKSVVINPASAITTPLNTATITTSPDTVISTLSILPPYYTLVYIQKL